MVKKSVQGKGHTHNWPEEELDGPKSLSPEQLFNSAQDDRPEYSQSERTINLADIDKVKKTVTSVQEGTEEEVWYLQGIPRNLNHQLFIEITQDYPDAHLFIPQTTMGERYLAPDYDTGMLFIESDVGGTYRQVASITSVGLEGGLKAIAKYVDLQGPEPLYDEGGALNCRGSSGEFLLYNSKFSGGWYGVVAYNAFVNLNTVDFGSNVITSSGCVPKHGGRILQSGSVSGNVGGYAYAGQGRILIDGSNSTLTGDSGLIDPDFQGYCRDYGKGFDLGKQKHLVQAWLTSDISITDTKTDIVFDTAQRDPYSILDTSTGEFSPAVDGFYRITVPLSISANAGDEIRVRLYNKTQAYAGADTKKNFVAKASEDHRQFSIVRKLFSSDTYVMQIENMTVSAGTLYSYKTTLDLERVSSAW